MWPLKNNYIQMNANYLKYVYYASSIVSVVVISLSVKYVLGGYEPIKVVDCGKIDFSIAGYNLSGVNFDDHSKIDSITTHLAQLIEVGAMQGEVSVLYEVKGQELKPVFAGIIVTSNVTTMPSSMSIHVLKHDRSLCTGTSMHPWVRPSRSELLELFDAHSQTNGLSENQLFLAVRGEGDQRSYFAFGE
jgi:hypothetical protein